MKETSLMFDQLEKQLSPLLKNGDEADRCNVTRFIAKLSDHSLAKPASYLPLLIERLRDEDIDVCIDAIEALGEYGSQGIGISQSIPALIELLFKDPDGETKTAAIKSLCKIGGHEVEATIVKLLADQPLEMQMDETEDWDSWWDIQLVAVKACGLLKIQAAVKPLEKLLLEDDIQDIDNEILNSLIQIGNHGETLVIQQAGNNSPTRRRRAIKALAQSQTSKAKQCIVNGLGDKHSDVKIQTIESLFAMKAFEYADDILLCLSDHNHLVRYEALKFFTQLKGVDRLNNELVNISIIKIKDPDERVRSLAMQLLLTLKSKNIKIPADESFDEQVLSSCHSDKMPEAVAAIQLLTTTSLDEQKITKQLINFIHSNTLPLISITAIEMLGSLNTIDYNTIYQLTKASQDPRETVRNAAIKQLIKLDPVVIQTESQPAQEMSVDLRLLAGARSCLFSIAKGEKIPNEPSIICVKEETDKIEEVATKVENLEKNETPTANKENIIDIVMIDESPASISNLDVSNLDTKHQEVASQLAANSNHLEAVEMQEALSTLDAILLDNQQVKSSNNDSQLTSKAKEVPEMLKDLPEDLQVYGAQLQKSLDNSNRLGIKKKIIPGDNAQLIAIRLISEINTPVCSNLLIELLQNNDELVRKEAAIAIGRFISNHQDEKIKQLALGPLISMLDSSNPDIRLAALVALGAMRKKVILSAFVNKLSDPEIGVRVQAIRSIIEVSQLGEEDKKLEGHLPELDLIELKNGIANALNDNDYSVQREALKAIGVLPLAFDLEPLLEQLIDLGLSQGGVMANDVAYCMSQLQTQTSSQQLLVKLSNSKNSSERRFILEMLSLLLVNEKQQAA